MSRVIFVPDDYWTEPPEENTVTDQQDDDITARMLVYRAQLAAVELCRAMSAGDPAAAEAMFDNEQNAGLLRELVAALTTFAVSLARTVAACDNCDDNTITESAIWDGLAQRAGTGLLGTAEIADLTGDDQ